MDSPGGRGDSTHDLASIIASLHIQFKPVILYGCEAWSLILREEHRLRVFENRALRKIF
jgi:hypothetical protein